MLPNPALLGNAFHDLYRSSNEVPSKSDWKCYRKRRWEAHLAKKCKSDIDNVGPPDIEIPGNASEFAVFSNVRRSVLEAWARRASHIYMVATSNVPLDAVDGDSDSTEATEVYHPPVQRLPKIVGVGLRSVLEIIRESRTVHPGICTRALAALLDILQGQQPEGLNAEPAEVIDPLFDLLLDLATTTPEGNIPTDGTHYTALACSCLLSLVVVRGSTAKILSATAALLMCSRSQNIQLPIVLTSLQRSVHAVLLGKLARPDWLTHGIPISTNVENFRICTSENLGDIRSLASDGEFLYFYTARGLFKVGSGLGSTVRGRVYHNVPDFFHDERGWLGFACGWLWLKIAGKKGCELLRIDRDPFRVLDTIRLDTKELGHGVWFSDGDLLGVIAPFRDEGFVVRTMNPTVKPLVVSGELSLKLARKCVDVIGCSAFEEETSARPLNTGSDEETVSVAVGKEFSLVRTANGKVLYSGKPSSLGLKIGGTKGRWNELPVPKSPRITHVTVGHEGIHAVLLADDGAVYFVGTPRRGEDGDQSKARRQPKALKPKRIMKVEGEFIVHAAANNGTTALVSKDGQLLMFGKDTVHCSPSTGQVMELKGVHVTQVALGKAHAVVLTSKGVVYTFGINNKGQCGRDFTALVKSGAQVVTAMETTGGDETCERVEEGEVDDAQDVMCPSGRHLWRHDLCMVCTVCRECTGYSISCLSSIRPDRNPGQECGCGEGDSGCAFCGCCRVCARENVDNSELAILGPSGAGDLAGMVRLDLIFGGEGQARAGSRLQDHLQRRLDERRQRQGRKFAGSTLGITPLRIISKKPGPSSSKGPMSAMLFRAPPPVKFSSLVASEEAAGGSDVERDATRVSSLPPAPLTLANAVTHIACGLHHTVLLTQPGDVFTFGSNVYGQLGVGDVLLRGGPVRVVLPCPAQLVAAGSNHTVVLTNKGEVYTFGSYQKGQLGRKSSSDANCRRDGPWYSVPGPIPNVGPRAGRRATWVGAAGDQTFLKLDESLINSLSLERSTLTANKSSILLIPNAENSSFHSLAINRRDGSCVSFSGSSQARLTGHAICLDPMYNVLWSFDGTSVRCDNVIACEARSLPSHSILEPSLCLPATSGGLVRRSQAAIHLLAAIDTLAQANALHMDVTPEIPESVPGPVKVFGVQDFSAVNRFESHGGGWGYSAHSIEAIRFMADADVILGGFGLFGGRGEYTAKIKLLDLGMDGGEQESDGEVIAETEDVQYECGARQKYPVMFDEPVQVQAHRWYVAWARISGPSSDCGANGQVMVTTEDQISFHFKSSKKSNNGTDVHAGQIPQLLYRLVTLESKPTPRQSDHGEPVYILCRDFSTTVSRECFEALIALLQWSWNSLKAGYVDSANMGSLSAQTDQERLNKLVYISRACLRLFQVYINDPNQMAARKCGNGEPVRLSESISDVRSVLRQILSDRPVTGSHKPLTDAVLEECHRTFVLVYHALYPTPYLKWTCLCQLLSKVDKSGAHFTPHDTLLAAVLAALCGPTVRLRSTLPLLSDPRTLSPSDTSPLLGEASRDVDGGGWAWREVLERLLDLVTLPVKRSLAGRSPLLSLELVSHGCHLLARIVAELASQSSGSDEDLQNSCGRVLHTTPSRFLRTNQSRTWNTGNGSPDAICFCVDRPGVVIAGACVYGGPGVYEYELELLDDSGSGVEPLPIQRWTSLEVAKGTFGPDDFMSDVAEIKFARPVPIKENVKYALRLRNQGGRTSNGDGGLSSIKGPDGVTFSFQTCSLSFNGTTQTRGQIPQILYYSNPQECDSLLSARAVAEHHARRTTLSMTSAILNRVCNLMSLARDKAEDLDVCRILGVASVVTTLLPLVLAHIGPLASSDPRSAVHVLHLVQELLPHVSALNLLNSTNMEEPAKVTTSHHYAWVESEHPYKPASVSNYRVAFPDTVKWVAIEFTNACGTAQNEDSLHIYIKARQSDSIWPDADPTEQWSNNQTDLAVPYWPVLRRLRGGQPWPQGAVILPGNEVIFSLETASDYIKDEKANMYGFKCLVVGYEWNPAPHMGLKHLESELVHLAGMCAASLIKKDLQLPPSSVEEIDEEIEEAAMLVANEHPELLARGLALSQAPSVTQALDGVLPLSFHSNERLFLRDLVLCTPGTSGGRLARWLQPESYADPSKCEVVFSRDDLRCGWPALLSVLTRDQYGDLVHVPSLKVDVKAIPIDKKEVASYDQSRKIRRVSEAEPATFGPGPPPMDIAYEVTVKDKVCYQAITMMKPFENYSFEELRFYSPTLKRNSENMLVRPNGDGTYSATWTPSTVGWYSVLVTVDDYSLEEVYKVEVKDPPQGMAPPSQSIVKKAAHQPSKLRKFVAKDSAGLRVRAHPSLQSEQIGVVHVNGTIAFIDEIHNDDGVWLRLNHDTMRQYCPSALTGVGEAWCLQYNQHLGKTLLLPVEEPRTILEQVISETVIRKLPDNEARESSLRGTYTVVKCGASGHNVRSLPSMAAPRVGMMVLGNQVRMVDQVVNGEGTWLKLSQELVSKFCFNHDGEAWSLALSPSDVLYLRHDINEKDGEHRSGSAEAKASSATPSPKRGFDFSSSPGNVTFGQPAEGFSFSSTPPPMASTSAQQSTNPFVFGTTSRDLKSVAVDRLSTLHKWLKGDDTKKERSPGSSNKDLEPQTSSAYKSMPESRGNGNGDTPPGTPPRRTSRSSSPRGATIPRPRASRSASPLGEKTSHSSSPVQIPVSGGGMADSAASAASQRRGSTQSDTSALVSSLTRDLSQSPLTKDSTPSPPSSSFHMRSEGSPPRAALDISGGKDLDDKDSRATGSGSGRAVIQTGTQTSPETSPKTAMKGHFSIGLGSGREERVSPKSQRKDRSGSKSSKRAMSPLPSQVLSSSSLHRTLNIGREAVKEAMSPSEAESLRATFAAFLWQEGIVHDAMACASFLKFHPNLPKEGATVVTRRMPSPRPDTLDQRHMQRHSVEVSTSGNYLHIQPATLESLTRSAANANASRVRRKVTPTSEASIREEGAGITVSVLPSALKGLVLIWEEVITICRRAIEQPGMLQSPSLPVRIAKNTALNKEKMSVRTDGKKSSRKKKDWKPVYSHVLNVLSQREERATVCELCGEIYPHPVTYHMRESHPGCGNPAGGKGYNSSGNFCVGWAGHCGDGGVGGSSWYLICDSCRYRFLRAKRDGAKERSKKSGSKKKTAATPTAVKILSPVLTQSISQDSHIVMRDNAMFLLELASATDSICHQEQKGPMPSVSETGVAVVDRNEPFSPVGPFQSLPFLGSHLPEHELETLIHRNSPRDVEESFNGNPTFPSTSRPLSAVDVEPDGQKSRLFHRSVSMGTNGAPWTKRGGDGRVIMTRRRNNSSGEVTADGGSSLLCHPSTTLQKLVPGLDQSAIVSDEERAPLDLTRRPSMVFMLRRHPLAALRLAMKHALRKATCRVFAFQALNWLLHNATQPGCLHDLLWWFLASFSPATPASSESETSGACEHPLSDITFAGDAAVPLWRAFHLLLQTVADLMLLLPPGSPLQTMAVRCWAVKFSQADHVFLHRSQVFSNISKILSKSEEEDDGSVSTQDGHSIASQQPLGVIVESLKDLTSNIEVKVSSRQAMVSSLTDNSTETFWESGDEDRNKTKSIALVCPAGSVPRMIYVHIDNSRDLANKVSSVNFLSGCNGEELIRIRLVEVESRASGWISCPVLDGRHSVLRLELKGPDNSLRVRQVRVLGESGENLSVGKLSSAAVIQQKICELETLKVFRLITSQVFGKLILGDTNLPPEPEQAAEPEPEPGEHVDLKEHVVGILFSRCKLTHLQKQVCHHIVQAIRKEASRVRDEWETVLCSPVPSEGKPSDAYAFEMLSMVLALTGSSVGRVYLSYQSGLLTDIFCLLHTGSARVQRQVIALLRRVLPEISPASLAKVLDVDKLPPPDFSISSLGRQDPKLDLSKMAILDVFLSVVAKALTLQVKVKGREGKGLTSVTLATAIHPRDPVGQRWWLRGCISRRLAEDMIQLLNDMSAGKLSDAWATTTKGAIAENIMNLTRLEESLRGPQECLRTPTLWLALASLCVLDQEHVDRLSSGQWTGADGQPAQPRPTCSNHDDGETGAIIQCSVCGNLCADCDRYLHLHRRTRMHQRQVCKEEEEAIKVDLHEGCGRTKLFWLLALADSSTLKAMVEFREGTRGKTTAVGVGVCRFCGTTGNQGLLAIGNICADADCQQYARSACTKVHPCGHVCGGLAGESSCLPCLQGCRPSVGLKQDADDMCMICFTEALACAPALLLTCGHVFHAHCTRLVLARRWAGPRISFSFAQCPICKAPMEHPILSPLLQPIRELWEDVRRKALMRLEYEGLHRVEAITTVGARFYNDPAAYAMDRYAYYVCFKCSKAYYGGEARCDVEMSGNYDPAELVCGACSDVARAQMCPKHGADFLEYKCRYCCSVAVFFCFGSTHFCNACHDDFQRVTNIPRSELPSCPAGPKAKQLEGEDCPLHVSHPPTGEEFALGCGVCRNAHTF